MAVFTEKVDELLLYAQEVQLHSWPKGYSPTLAAEASTVERSLAVLELAGRQFGMLHDTFLQLRETSGKAVVAQVVAFDKDQAFVLGTSHLGNAVAYEYNGEFDKAVAGHAHNGKPYVTRETPPGKGQRPLTWNTFWNLASTAAVRDVLNNPERSYPPDADLFAQLGERALKAMAEPRTLLMTGNYLRHPELITSEAPTP